MFKAANHFTTQSVIHDQREQIRFLASIIFYVETI